MAGAPVSGRGEQPVRPGRAVGRDHGSLAHWNLRRDLIRYPGASSRSRGSQPAGMQQVAGAMLWHVGWQQPPPSHSTSAVGSFREGKTSLWGLSSYLSDESKAFISISLSVSLLHDCWFSKPVIAIL